MKFNNVDVDIDCHRWYCDITITDTTYPPNIPKRLRINMETGNGMWLGDLDDPDYEDEF